MILGFKTQVKGKPTHFVQKILACKIDEYRKAFTPKIHTIRGGNRWKPGNSIQMATGVRTKKYFRFNGDGIGLDECKGVQAVEIIRVDDLSFSEYEGSGYIVEVHVPKLNKTFSAAFRVKIDGRYLSNEEIRALSVNDGFETPEQMFWWFNLDCFSGQLIHWTDFKY